MTRTLPAALFAAAALLLPLQAEAPAPPSAPPAGGARQARIVKALGLSPDQQQRIQAIHAAHHTDLKAAHTAQRTARQALHQALKDPATSDAQIRSLHQALADQQLAALLARRHQQQEIRQVLTPEQRERAAELRGRIQGARRARFQERSAGPR